MIFVNLIGVVVGILILIHSIMLSKRTGNTAKIKFTLISALCTSIAALSWIMNMGWLRFIFTLFAIPTIHSIIFLIVNDFTLTYIDKSPVTRLYFILSCITYLAGYLFLPDGGDNGVYVFWGLVSNETVVSILGSISYFAFIANIIIFVFQIIERIRIKRKTELFDMTPKS